MMERTEHRQQRGPAMKTQSSKAVKNLEVQRSKGVKEDEVPTRDLPTKIGSRRWRTSCTSYSAVKQQLELRAAWISTDAQG